MGDRCLYCYKPLKPGEMDFHPRCAKKMFGTSVAPTLPYTRAEIANLAKEVIKTQTTLTGVQPKLSLDISEETNHQKRLTIVGVLGGRFILKPQAEQIPYLPEIEDLSMHLAETLKIDVVPHSLIRFADGELCYITRRIDRAHNGLKLTMEDMCQLSERLTEDKYKGSHERVAKIITRYSSYAGLDLAKYWEQVVFSFVIGNADMHLKNYSLYSPDNENILLTPAYDLVSTKLVMPEDTEELALTVDGKKRRIRREIFLNAMLTTGLPAKVAERIFEKIEKAYPKMCAVISESFLPTEIQEQYKVLIADNLSRITTINGARGSDIY